MVFHFNKTYFTLALMLFAVELWIALFVTDKVIRPFIGDVLVVILLYCLVSIFIKNNRLKIAFGVFLLACLIEIFQYFDYVKILGLENNRVLSVLLGRTFEPMDFAAYLTGFLIVLSCEKIYGSQNL